LSSIIVLILFSLSELISLLYCCE